MNIHAKTGDGFALPLALALAAGRWGCFFNGCCFGQPTALPWGVDFGDGVFRHPTQIYESFLHLGMALVLWQVMRRGSLRCQRLKLYLIAYCVFRFVTEWIRPEPTTALGMTVYQAIVAVFAIALILQWVWDQNVARRREAADRISGSSVRTA